VQQLHVLLDRAMASRDLDEAIKLRDLIHSAEESASTQPAGEAEVITNTLPKPITKPTIVRRGNPVADSLYWAACDFVINVWHNGDPVNWKNRKLEAEVFGRTAERLPIDLREGDWVVFQLANNIVRGKGGRLFIAGALLNDKPVIETSASSPWFFEDNPGKAGDFMASYDSGREQNAVSIPTDEAWGDGVKLYKRAFPQTKAEPIWGNQPVTWIKLRLPRLGQQRPGNGR
jgi:hypothetical protein